MRLTGYIAILVFSLSCLTGSSALCQTDTTFRLSQTYDYDIASFAVNNIGELYIINSANQLKKFNNKGDSEGVYNEISKYGPLAYVVARNPWKTLLFYKNYSTIVILDKYLNVLTNINLRKNNIFRVKSITASYDNNIWLFDEQDGKLKKIDDAGKVLLETVDMRSIFDSVPSPEQIIDREGYVYLNDPGKGIYVFDYYGSFKNKLTFLQWKDIEIAGKYIYGFDDSNFYKYNLGSLNLQKFAFPGYLRDNASLKIVNNALYVLKNNRLQMYNIHN